MKPKYKTPYEYLENHYKRVKAFHTRFNTSGNHKWLPYRGKDYLGFYGNIQEFVPNHRECLPDEVVIDCDFKAEWVRVKVGDRLKETELAYSFWDSGNKGCHAHIYFNGLGLLTYEDRKIMKKLITKYYFGDMIKSCKIDTALVSRHMIRSEYGKHEKTKAYKSFITADRELEKNDIHANILDKFKETKAAYLAAKSRVKSPSTPDNPPECVKFFLGDDFKGAKDGRKMALFVLTSWFKEISMDDDEILDNLLHINHYSLHDYWTMPQMIGSMRSTKGTLRCSGRHDILENMDREDVAQLCFANRRK